MPGAAAGATEIERLLVRVVGDATSVMKSMNDTVKSLNKVDKAAKDTQRSVQGSENVLARFGGNLRLFGQNALQALGAIKIKGWVQDAVHEFSQAETALTRLNAAMKVNGKATSETGETYEKFAKDMEKITVVGDDVVTSMLATAESQGLSGEAAMRAVKNAVSLAAKSGSASGAEGMIRQGIMIEKGMLAPLKRLVPELRSAKTGAEQAAIATKALQQGFAQAEEETGTHAGSLKQLANSYGNFKEEIGKVAAIGLKPLIALLKQTTDWLQSLSDEAKTNIVVFAGLAAALLALDPLLTLLASLFSPVVIALLALAGVLTVVAQRMGGFEVLWAKVKSWGLDAWDAIQARIMEFVEWVTPYWEATVEYLTGTWVIFSEELAAAWPRIQQAASDFWEWLKSTAAETLIVARFAVENFSDIFSLTWMNIQLEGMRAFGDIEHFFTVTIPTIAQYAFDTFRDVFYDIFDMATTVFGNLTGNIVNVFRYLPNLAVNALTGGAAGIGLDQIWTPLTDGFKSNVKEFLGVLPREMSAAEAALTEEAEKLGAKLQANMDRIREEVLAPGPDVGGGGFFGAGSEDGGDFGGGGDFGDNLAKKLKPKVPIPEDKLKKGRVENTKFDAAAFGSIEAFSRISSFQDLVSGKTDDPLTSIDEKMTKQNELLTDIRDNQGESTIDGGDF